ncbi:hypothetical protein [Frankia tisae]|uniref:hypothetical protein n=1 Tax=Frankia tisae TaxID=2950104 RepID=UPI0021C1BA3A|nr:hypothetical protein [Frankia tisae]
MEFGPANVTLHEMSVAVDLGDTGDALGRAARIDTAGLSPERRIHFLVNVARAHAQRRARGSVLAALMEAKQVAPNRFATIRGFGPSSATCFRTSACALTRNFVSWRADAEYQGGFKRPQRPIQKVLNNL